MQPLTSDAGAASAPQQDPFEARMARAAGPSSSLGPGRRRSGKAAARGLGWKAWVCINVAGVMLFLALFTVWPPLDACRTKAREIGLYAGDSIEKCTWRGIDERLTRVDQRIKKLVRGSGQ